MPGINFLFWNVNRRPLETRVARLAAARGVDVVMLAEYAAGGTNLLSALEVAGAGGFHEADGSGDRLRVFTRLPRQTLRFQFPDPNGGWLIYRVVLGSVPEFFLALAHLPSKVNITAETQAAVARYFAADIATVERGRAEPPAHGRRR